MRLDAYYQIDELDYILSYIPHTCREENYDYDVFSSCTDFTIKLISDG